MPAVEVRFCKDKKKLYEEFIRPELYDFAGIYKSKLTVIGAMKVLGLDEYLDEEIDCLKEAFDKYIIPRINTTVILDIDKVCDDSYVETKISHYAVVIRCNERTFIWDFNGDNTNILSLFNKVSQTRIKESVKEVLQEIHTEFERKLKKIKKKDKTDKVLKEIEDIKRELETTYRLTKG